MSFDEERASTIGPEGIGGYPIPAKPLAALREVNPFTLQCMKRDIVTLQETLELLEASMDLPKVPFFFDIFEHRSLETNPERCEKTH